jgi:hypothetical protein
MDNATYKIHFALTGKTIKISLRQITDKPSMDELNIKEKAWIPENVRNAGRSFRSGSNFVPIAASLWKVIHGRRDSG